MNITLILTDQQRFDSIGAVNELVHTPFLNDLCTVGVRCERAYTTSPQCQPARASLFTGRFPTAHKLWWNGLSLNRQEMTIANYLSQKGYKCAYFGKDHFNVTGENDHLKHFGFTGPNYGLQHWMRDFPGNFNHLRNLMKHPFWTGEWPAKEGHPDWAITRAATEWMRTPTNEPKFTVVGFHGPHPPYAAPPPYNTSYAIGKQFAEGAISESGHVMSADNWTKLISQYYGSISWIDELIGAVFRASTNDDLVIFTSDHGDMLGDHQQFSKGLFGFEGVTRVPLIIKHNAFTPGVYPHIVRHIDILPTIMELLGEKRPVGVQGKSMIKALRNGHPYNDCALSMIGHTTRVRSIATEVAKYWVHNDKEYLFRLDQDPLEFDNLIDDEGRQGLRNRMRALLIKALIEAEDPLPIPLENM